MVVTHQNSDNSPATLSVLALSSRFDGPERLPATRWPHALSVLALSSRFDGQQEILDYIRKKRTFSTRSVESF